MTRKTLGYTQLQWMCPACGTQNRGTARFCINCGTAQPEDVEFHQASHEQILTDIETVKKAKAGADIYCFYCGTRNPADAVNCSQCGADLSQGTRRESGKVIGAFQASSNVEPIPCSSCGQMVDPDAATCPYCGSPIHKPEKPKPQQPPVAAKTGGGKGVLIGIALFLLLACVGIYFLFIRTSDATARVQSVHWTRAIAIEALAPVRHENWRDQIPADAVIGTCTQKVARVQDSPAPNAKEVCGTPYTVDKGNGYGEVVQDCQYEVYADWCNYTVQEWQVVDQVVAEGDDLAPQDPQMPVLSGNQRAGGRSATYEILFDADGETYTFTTEDEELFRRAQPGSRWVLKVNTLGAVTHIEPAD